MFLLSQRNDGIIEWLRRDRRLCPVGLQIIIQGKRYSAPPWVMVAR